MLLHALDVAGPRTEADPIEHVRDGRAHPPSTGTALSRWAASGDASKLKRTEAAAVAGSNRGSVGCGTSYLH